MKNLRYALLKNPENFSENQQSQLLFLTEANPRLYRAYLLKENLRLALKAGTDDITAALPKWMAWAQRCRILEFRQLRLKTKRHFAAIVATAKHLRFRTITEKEHILFYKISKKRMCSLMVKDLIGQKFGRLTVVQYEGQNKHCNAVWVCRCECGNEKIVVSDSLIRGKTKSCGCLNKEQCIINLKRSKCDSLDYDFRKTCLYRIGIGMKTRCYNSNSEAYQKWYG